MSRFLDCRNCLWLFTTGRAENGLGIEAQREAVRRDIEATKARDLGIRRSRVSLKGQQKNDCPLMIINRTALFACG